MLSGFAGVAAEPEIFFAMDHGICACGDVNDCCNALPTTVQEAANAELTGLLSLDCNDWELDHGSVVSGTATITTPNASNTSGLRSVET
jgi:hypothetical protein